MLKPGESIDFETMLPALRGTIEKKSTFGWRTGLSRRGPYNPDLTCLLLPAAEIAALEIVRVDLDHKARIFTQEDQCRALFEIDLLPACTFSRHGGTVDFHFFRPCRRRAAGQGRNDRNDFGRP